MHELFFLDSSYQKVSPLCVDTEPFLSQLTFELLDVAQQEHVRVLHLQVKFDSLEQNSLQHHHLFLLEEIQIPQLFNVSTSYNDLLGALRQILYMHASNVKGTFLYL